MCIVEVMSEDLLSFNKIVACNKRVVRQEVA
jgi:hypothetical protein